MAAQKSGGRSGAAAKRRPWTTRRRCGSDRGAVAVVKRVGATRRMRGDRVMILGLKGKVVVVTGGSAGIGPAAAEGLAREGANLLLAARNEARVDGEAGRDVRRRGPGRRRRRRHATRWSRRRNAPSAPTSSSTTPEPAPPRPSWRPPTEVAGLLGPARHGGGAAGPQHRPADAAAGFMLHDALIRAVQPLWYEAIYDVEGGADDVLENPGG